MPGTDLDGGCFVLAPDQLDYRRGGVWHEAVVVDAGRGARALSQYAVRVKGRPTDACSHPGSEVVLYVLSGHGLLEIGDRRFDLGPGVAAFVAPDEAFRLASEDGESLELLVTVCPQCEAAKWHAKPTERFGDDLPERTVKSEDRERHESGERSFTLLVNEAMGCRKLTQFEGFIPKSRPPEHYHPYEEVIMILDGEGVMRTGEKSADVRPGSLIFLPREQRHSLESTSQDGLRLVGVIHPPGSPAEAYE